MTDKTSSKVEMESTAKMCEAFYTDFMPMIQKIKSNAESLEMRAQNRDTLNNIHEQLERAERLLKQMISFSHKSADTNTTKANPDTIKADTFKYQSKEEEIQKNVVKSRS